MRSIRNLTLFIGIALLAAAPVLGAGVITNGIDTWTTTNDGSSFIDFSQQPIPADFFCLGSDAFSGRIEWQGKPLASVPADALGQADTIVQRLDDAIFDRDGVATTRLQVRVLSLQSLQPIHTSCGSFHVSAALHGVQPMTEMTIRQTKDGSGTFDATLAMNVRLTFTRAPSTTPVAAGRASKLRLWGPPALTLDHLMQLDTPVTAWQSEPLKLDQAGQIGGFVLVDTDDDGTADTYIPGQSAFHPVGARTDSTKRTLVDDRIDDSDQCASTPTSLCHPSGQYDSNGVEKCHCVGFAAE